MTSAVAALEAAVPEPDRARAGRLHPLAEFLLVGGLSPLLFPLAWAARRAAGADAAELAIGFLCFHAAHVVNDPHFSVTYLLFYRDVKRRALGDAWSTAGRVRYVVAGFVVPFVLVAWAGGALVLRSAVGLGWLIQLMFVLVGWHYVKQGFGVLAVLSSRSGAPLDRAERRVFLAHALAAWAYAWASPADPGREVEERGIVYTSIPHGALLENGTLVLFAASAVAVLHALIRRFRSGRASPPLAALAGYFAALWLWTVYSRVEPLVVYVIPALHSVQYLYFVWLSRRNELLAEEARAFASNRVAARLGLFLLSAVALGWVIFHGVPEVLDAEFFGRRGRALDLGNLGATPIVAAVFVCVNVHHYFMDSVIWRRESQEARHLAGA